MLRSPYARGNKRRFTLSRRLGGPQNRSRGRGEDILFLPGIEPRLLGRPDLNLVAILTEISQSTVTKKIDYKIPQPHLLLTSVTELIDEHTKSPLPPFSLCVQSSIIGRVHL
jgi:hypothetical protein